MTTFLARTASLLLCSIAWFCRDQGAASETLLPRSLPSFGPIRYFGDRQRPILLAMRGSVALREMRHDNGERADTEGLHERGML